MFFSNRGLCLIIVVVVITTKPSVGQIDCEPTLSITVNGVNEDERVVFKCEPKSPVPCSKTMTSVSLSRKTYGLWEKAIAMDAAGSVDGSILTNDVDYSARVDGQLEPPYSFLIDDTIIEDNGQWMCVFVNEGNGAHESNDEELQIYANPSTIVIGIISPDFILLGSPSEYKCLCDRVYPAVNVTWIVNGVNYYNGSTDYTQDDAIFALNSTNEFVFTDKNTIDVMCRLENTFGESWTKNDTADSVQTYAPASIKEALVYPDEPTPSQTLFMTCTVSGTNHELTWRYGEGDLDITLFNETRVQINGTFDFGETVATNSTLTWKLIPTENSCEVLNSYNGKYLCRASAKKGPDKDSSEYEVTVRYAPILAKPDDALVNARLNETVPMSCKELCASPSQVTYTWTSERGRDDLDKNQSIIYITLTETDFKDIFTCAVENRIGFANKTFQFNKMDDTTLPDPSVTTTPLEETTTIDPGEPADPNQALVTAFAVIWSLCGVFAVLLVCLALYHYRQIQNGKKYKGEYSEELVLTEDEAQPGTSQDSGVYDDISPAVVGKGSVSKAVGGVTNEGLYAEVQRPAQTQIPIAPEPTSKEHASNQNLGTPKTKRTQAPSAPESPMNARPQPNSTSSDRRPEPKADYSPVSSKNEMPPKHSNESNHGTVAVLQVSKVVHRPKRHESPNKPAAVKQNINGAKPSVPDKPNITSIRLSKSSDLNPVGASYENAEVNVYANYDQRPQVPRTGDDTITYADLALQQEDPYDEGAPPVPTKNMNDQEPVQYASIKHGK